MGKYQKLIGTILSGRSDNNIPFDQLCRLLCKLGFNERVKGSHHIFYREDLVDIINIQAKGGRAKSYQVKQVRKLILTHKLFLEDGE